MAILRCENVTQRFGELAAVDDVSFEVEEGEVFGIAGPNGAGKTTLFNVITGFYKGTGKIFFKNENILGLKTHQVCHKGIVRTFQIPTLFLTLTLAENITVGAHYGGQGSQGEQERINEAIKLTGLTGKEDVIAENLNLFDKKRTMLAAGLATKPKLFLLDEPIGGLSPTETTDFINLVKQINQEIGLTIIIIEHLMKVLTELSTRMMILHNGARIALGPPAEVCSDQRVLDVYLGSKHHA
jgi:branched-chain amino acid transport system ATP-binding protein